MTDQVQIQIPRPKVKEGSAFTATAYFRDRATSAASVPTSIKYRVDCLTTGVTLTDWTTVTAAASASIAVTATNNAIRSAANVTERKQLTVAANYGLETQSTESVAWEVENNAAY